MVSCWLWCGRAGHAARMSWRRRARRRADTAMAAWAACPPFLRGQAGLGGGPHEVFVPGLDEVLVIGVHGWFPSAGHSASLARGCALVSLAGWPASETSVSEGCCNLVGIVLNRQAGWSRRLVAGLAGGAGQGGPGPLGQGSCPPVLV
jgi:hypothetical protein